MSATTSTTSGTTPAGTGRPARRVRAAHLALGVAFLAWALVWGLLAVGAVEAADLRWLVPLPFILGGAAGLVAPVLTARRHERA